MQPKITDEEIEEIIDRIARSSFKAMKKAMNNEFERLNQQKKQINANHYINISLHSLSLLSGNIIIMMRKVLSGISSAQFDFPGFMNAYLDYILQLMTDDEKRIFAEKFMQSFAREKLH